MQNRAFLYFDVFSTSDRESELWDTLWRNHIENYGDTIKKEGGAFIDELFITIIKTLMEKKSDLWRYGRLNPNLDRSKEASIVFFPRCLGLLYSSWVRRWPSFPRLKISVNREEKARPHSKMTCAACPKPPSISRYSDCNDGRGGEKKRPMINWGHMMTTIRPSVHLRICMTDESDGHYQFHRPKDWPCPK